MYPGLVLVQSLELEVHLLVNVHFGKLILYTRLNDAVLRIFLLTQARGVETLLDSAPPIVKKDIQVSCVHVV